MFTVFWPFLDLYSLLWVIWNVISHSCYLRSLGIDGVGDGSNCTISHIVSKWSQIYTGSYTVSEKWSITPDHFYAHVLYRCTDFLSTGKNSRADVCLLDFVKLWHICLLLSWKYFWGSSKTMCEMVGNYWRNTWRLMWCIFSPVLDMCLHWADVLLLLGILVFRFISRSKLGMSIKWLRNCQNVSFQALVQ